MGTTLTLGVIYLWDRLLQRQGEIDEKHEIKYIKTLLPNGVSFYDEFYIYKSAGKVAAYSTSCTHAGCRLRQEENGIISCSCHGSRFEASSGKPVKGPAFKPLKELNCRFDVKTGEWVIRL